MKRILMLKPEWCGSGDFCKEKIYDVTEDKMFVYKEVKYEDGSTDKEAFEYEYNEENLQEYSDFKYSRWITVKDDGNVDDCFEYCEGESCILFENDKELAHELINRIEGLDKSIVSMAMLFYK